MSSGFTHEPAHSEFVDWCTPKWLFDAMGARFDLDPACPPAGKPPWIPATHFLTAREDGLKSPWGGFVWLNPPYNRKIVKRWTEKMRFHGNGVLLVCSRTDTEWFHEDVIYADVIYFMRKRVKFVDRHGNQYGSPGVGSLLAGWGDAGKTAVLRAASILGGVVYRDPTDIYRVVERSG